MKHMVEIDLANFGGEGTMIMKKPGVSKVIAKRNAMGRCGKATGSKGGNVTLSEPMLGDLELIEVLSYVHSAPFPTDINGFLAFCDALDEATADSELEDTASVMMYDAMSNAVNELRAASPFAGSQSPTTENSE